MVIGSGNFGSKPILFDCRLDQNHFLTRKNIWWCCLQNGGHRAMSQSPQSLPTTRAGSCREISLLPRTYFASWSLVLKLCIKCGTVEHALCNISKQFGNGKGYHGPTRFREIWFYGKFRRDILYCNCPRSMTERPQLFIIAVNSGQYFQ